MTKIVRNTCHKLRACPASQYLSCEAYLHGLECWQVKEPRCVLDMRFCLQYGCPVYDRCKVEIEESLRERALERR